MLYQGKVLPLVLWLALAGRPLFQSLRIRPERDRAQLYRRLAALLRDMGDRKGAVGAARKVAELDPRLAAAA